MERKLASVVRIADIQPIPNADAIEVASVKGWKVVVKKQEFRAGDLAIYCEIDSYLPVKPEFEFLRKSSFKRTLDGREGFRLRTLKLRGQISQGLLLPLNFTTNEGDDVTEKLGIVKYEPPVPVVLTGEPERPFPGYIPKTDEERIQNLEIDIAGKAVYITEKLDGSSFTVYWQNDQFGVCSRNIDLKENNTNIFWRVAKSFKLPEKLASLRQNIALQGELVGPGIQGNVYRLKDHTVYFFTCYDIDSQTRKNWDSLKLISLKLELETVPLIQKEFSLPTQNTVEWLLQYAQGRSALNQLIEREGIVIRSLTHEFSFKAVSNQYLLQKTD